MEELTNVQDTLHVGVSRMIAAIPGSFSVKTPTGHLLIFNLSMTPMRNKRDKLFNTQFTAKKYQRPGGENKPFRKAVLRH